MSSLLWVFAGLIVRIAMCQIVLSGWVSKDRDAIRPVIGAYMKEQAEALTASGYEHRPMMLSSLEFSKLIVGTVPHNSQAGVFQDVKLLMLLLSQISSITHASICAY
ncbi:hypothetical protein LINPERHAP2_LOCUS18930 [Linum perenne]